MNPGQIKPVLMMPELWLELDGNRLSTTLTQGLSAARVQQRLSMPALCELTFQIPANFNLESVFRLQVRLQLKVFRTQELLFDGEITALEEFFGPSNQHELQVRAYDLLYRLRQSQPLRAHVDVSLKSLAEKTLSEFGITVEATDAGPVWSRILQHGQTDWELLLELGNRAGLYFDLQNNQLQIMDLAGIGETISLKLGESLYELKIEQNLAAACQTVQASGWNPLRVESFNARATSTRTTHQNSTADTLETYAITGETLLDLNHAQALAQAELDRRAVHGLTMHGVASGNPGFRPGARVLITGHKTSLEEQFVLTSVNHSIDLQHGFISELSSSPPPPLESKKHSFASQAVISRVDDPDMLGRVRATLPAFGNLETDWMQVLIPGAGAGKGLVLLPDIEDQVLVFFANGDPGQAVVLGGLYGALGAPDSGVEGNAVRRFTLLTSGGHLLRFDNAKGSVRLEDRHGSYLELSAQKVRLHAETDLELDAPGKRIVLRGQAIDLEQA
jgi:uncharacterized protein involved in type VI secretion and phage assembly